MTVPAPRAELKITSLGTDLKYFPTPIKSVKLLGYDGSLKWKQAADGLMITCPDTTPFKTAVTFKIE
jgi:alpha-L-fucosidase